MVNAWLDNANFRQNWECVGVFSGLSNNPLCEKISQLTGMDELAAFVVDSSGGLHAWKMKQ